MATLQNPVALRSRTTTATLLTSSTAKTPKPFSFFFSSTASFKPLRLVTLFSSKLTIEPRGDGALGARIYESFDISNILVNNEPPKKKDLNQPYSLGPKISNWDEQRRNWLKNNPNFPNFIQPNKPKVLLVTRSSPKPCENPVCDHYLLKSIKNKIDYCRIHGIEIFYNLALLDAEMARFWAKLPLIRKLLLSHPEIEFLRWMNSDAIFTDDGI